MRPSDWIAYLAGGSAVIGVFLSWLTRRDNAGARRRAVKKEDGEMSARMVEATFTAMGEQIENLTARQTEQEAARRSWEADRTTLLSRLNVLIVQHQLTLLYVHRLLDALGAHSIAAPEAPAGWSPTLPDLPPILP